ncbi:MAG: Hpt domain-containing protein [Alphaproteobacteria bacterium]|nr:Hpt domain-containing protein [Alphaproteobacteria bacterium]MBL7099519.1 Hpt domain-containing protein [Alphaproteobacteria bacterium]
MTWDANTIVDLDHLARYTGGDRAINAEVMRLFDVQATDLVGRLNAILDARDAKSWKDVTHTLKGAARGIGAFGLGDAAAYLEPMDLKDRPLAESGIVLLKQHSDAVQAFIRRYLAAA